MQDLRKFIEYAAGLPDVWFVTTQQVGPAGTCSVASLQGPYLAGRKPPHTIQTMRRCCPFHAAAPAVTASLLLPLQLLSWMDNPVPASRVEQQLKCEKPTDIQADNVCETYVG